MNNQARHTNVLRNQEDYNTQVSEEIEGRVTKELFQELSRTESRILGTLSKLDEFVLNPQAQVHSGLVPETSRSSNGDNQETNEDRSQNEPYPEVGVSLSQSSQEFGPDETSYGDSSKGKRDLLLLKSVKLNWCLKSTNITLSDWVESFLECK